MAYFLYILFSFHKFTCYFNETSTEFFQNHHHISSKSFLKNVFNFFNSGPSFSHLYISLKYKGCSLNNASSLTARSICNVGNYHSAHLKEKTISLPILCLYLVCDQFSRRYEWKCDTRTAVWVLVMGNNRLLEKSINRLTQINEII